LEKENSSKLNLNLGNSCENFNKNSSSKNLIGEILFLPICHDPFSSIDFSRKIPNLIELGKIKIS
jgi:hypothetical protein